MKKKISISSTGVIACLICFLLAFFVTVQVRTINKSESDILRLKNENELIDEVNQWKEMYNSSVSKINELNKRVEEYQNVMSTNDDAVALVKSDLDKASILAGLTAVKGRGVTVNLDDTKALEQIALDAGVYDRNVYIIHDTDIISIINELAAAGAEAVSVNGQRIVATSAIRCVGPLIQINDVKLAAPFTISAIGEPDTLVGALNLRGGVISQVEAAKIEVTIAKQEEIIIPAYDKVIQYQYAMPVAEVNG